MNKLKTALAFTKNLKTTGALFQTSSKVENEIVSKINPETSKIVVEFGVGHGNITQKILEKMPVESKLFAFEVNKEFCEIVKETIKDPRLEIINDSATNLDKYVSAPIDNIISSIPLTILPKETVKSILTKVKNSLKKEGFFSQVQYSKILSKKLKACFGDSQLVKLSYIPPEFIFHSKKV